MSLTFCTEERERSYAIKNQKEGHSTRKYSSATMSGHSKKRDRVKRMERDIKIIGGQVDSYAAVSARLLRQQKILASAGVHGNFDQKAIEALATGDLKDIEK